MTGEIIKYLEITKGQKYIDCTLGDGGHTIEILKCGGNVLGIDADQTSIDRTKQRVDELGLGSNLTIMHGNFRNLENIATANNFNKVSGILYDLGFSSYQLDEANLGLSFLREAPLDMRMDPTLGVTAADLVNALSENELINIFYNYGNEHYARRFAKAIVEFRKLKQFHSTKDLVDLIVKEAPPGYEHGRINPATRIFLALRVAVNDEMGNFKKSLPQAARLLLPGGRIGVLTFNSLEDNLVKEFVKDVRSNYAGGVQFIRSIKPNEDEIGRNSRARSAKLHVMLFQNDTDSI